MARFEPLMPRTLNQPSLPVPAAEFARVFALEISLLMFGGRRESRVSNAPAALRVKIENTQVSHHRFTGSLPAFPAQWF
jgi:hypothetical protein